MKKLLCLSMIFIFLLGCENTQKSNGFNTAYKDYSFHIGSQSSVDVVVKSRKLSIGSPIRPAEFSLGAI